MQSHVHDVDGRAAERERDLGHDARAVGDRHAQLDDVAARSGGPPAGAGGRRRRASFQAATASPSPSRRRRARGKPRDRVVEQRAEGVGVGR